MENALWAIFGKQLAMWDEPIVELKCLNISLIETIKGVDPY